MGRKVLNATLVLLILGILVLVARDNLSLEDWTTSKGDDEALLGDSAEGQED